MQSTSASAQSFTVNWAGERLTIVATEAPLATVLAEIGRQTGTTFVGLERVAGVATLEIRDALLLDVLTTLLRRTDYVMTAPVHADARVVVWLEGRDANRMADAASRTARADVPEGEQRSNGPDPSLPYDLAAAREFRARPSPAEAETARLAASGLFNPDAPESSLLGAAKATDAGVRVRALQTLALQNTHAGAQAIKAALNDENPFVRAEALDLLMHLGASGPESVGYLSDLLTHKDPAVRFPAAMALAEQSGDEAEFQLKRALNDDDSAVKETAAQLLQQRDKQKRKRNP
jgi:hypothetical protein